MSKRGRYTSNNVSLIVGKIHRRVFRDLLQIPAAANATNATPTGSFTFGLDNLPRRPGFVWAAEVIKVNFQFQNNIPTFDASVVLPRKFYAGLSTSNSTDLFTWLNANTGPANAYRRDEIIAIAGRDLTQYLDVAGNPPLATYRISEMESLPVVEDTVNLTDLMGQGVLVFGDNLWIVSQLWSPTGGVLSSSQYVTAEVWFKYVEVPLEYYLSTQQDAAASGV